jgi:FPC/CPF motif-containing protein YcgG
MQNQGLSLLNRQNLSVPAYGHIYLQREIESSEWLATDWRSQALKKFLDTVCDEDFPCLFGRKAQKETTIRFLFCQKLVSAQFENFFSGLMQYTSFVRETPLAERLYAPLVVFFDESYTLELPQQHFVAWQALNWVHARDPKEWPAEVPTDPEHTDWCFCFNGVQLFINISTRNHKLLRSRNLGRFLTLVINPRENFDAVASAETRSGRLIRERIRSRIAHFNNGIVPPELGFYGQPESREWQQYQLSEAGIERPLHCPFIYNTF